MIKYIYELCKKRHCSVDLRIGADSDVQITVVGKRCEFLMIGANWSEDAIKECIDDAVRRASDAF